MLIRALITVNEEEGEEGGRARGGVLGVRVKRVVVGLGLGLGC